MGEKVKAFGKLPEILTFPFKGEGWLGKMAIASGVMLAGSIIPVLPGIILLGYFYEMVRRMIVEGEDASLPEWDDWGDFLSNGFKWFVSTLIIAVPLAIVSFLWFILMFVPIIFAESGAEEVIMPFFMLIFFFFFILMFISMILMGLMAIFSPVYMTHIVAKGELKAMFQVKEWWQIFKKGFWEFVVSFLLMFGLAMVLYYVYYFVFASIICCCLSPFVLAFASVYTYAVYMALVASAYREGNDKMPADNAPKLDAGPAAIEPEVLPEPEPVSVEAPAPVEDFGIPSPDGEPAEDATVISGVNEEVAQAMGFAESTVKMDNLKKIDGVGPKTADILNQNGILTYAQLAETPVEKLQEILSANGLERFAGSAEGWINQAKDL